MKQLIVFILWGIFIPSIILASEKNIQITGHMSNSFPNYIEFKTTDGKEYAIEFEKSEVNEQIDKYCTDGKTCTILGQLGDEPYQIVHVISINGNKINISHDSDFIISPKNVTMVYKETKVSGTVEFRMYPAAGMPFYFLQTKDKKDIFLGDSVQIEENTTKRCVKDALDTGKIITLSGVLDTSGQKYLSFVDDNFICLNISKQTGHSSESVIHFYGISLNSSIENVLDIAKENNYPVTATGILKEQYSLPQGWGQPLSAIDALHPFLLFDQHYNSILIEKAQEANNNDNADSFINDIFLGTISIWIEKNEAIVCYFIKINDEIKILDINMHTQDMELFQTISNVFHERYGNPQKIDLNHPDSNKKFNSSRPIRETNDAIWKVGNEICVLSRRYTNQSGFVNIYNPSTISQVVNLLENRADKIIQERKDAIKNKKLLKDQQRRSKI